MGVGGSRWKVSLTCSHNGSAREGQLPLSGVNLPGGVQRIRTSEDVLAMRNLFKEGDLVSCEVQNVQRDGTLILHTRYDLSWQLFYYYNTMNCNRIM